jgi:serine/threonine protein kinase
MKLERGTRVQDYTLVERLGAGAFGEVWKAAHVHLPRVAAIKFATSDTAIAALERAGVAQGRLDHPGIVKVLDANLRADPPYVVLEYVEGRSLRQLLRERGRFEIQDVASIFRQLGEALAFAHRAGVVHGDVKPENILVVEDGVRRHARLTDFQLGSFAAGDRPEIRDGGVRPSLKTTTPSGTYHYLAPEQELGGAIDARADLYALGVVLFEMATGTLPQGRDLPSDVNPAISWWWDHIFARSYTGRERRYASADELLQDVTAAESGPAWGEMPSQRRRAARQAAEVSAAAATVAATSTTGAQGPRPLPCASHAQLAARLASIHADGVRVRTRRSSALAGLFAGLFALAVPVMVLHSIAAMPSGRCVGPRRRLLPAAAPCGLERVETSLYALPKTITLPEDIVRQLANEIRLGATSIDEILAPAGSTEYDPASLRAIEAARTSHELARAAAALQADFNSGRFEDVREFQRLFLELRNRAASQGFDITIKDHDHWIVDRRY